MITWKDGLCKPYLKKTHPCVRMGEVRVSLLMSSDSLDVPGRDAENMTRFLKKDGYNILNVEQG